MQPTSHGFVLPMTTAINPSTISHAAPTANAKKNVTKRREMSSWPNSTSPSSTDGTTSSSNVTMVSKDGINNSATNFNRIPMSLATFTTGDFSGVTKSAATISTSTATPSNSTVTYSTPSAAVLPSDNSSTNPTALFPTGITLTSPTVKQDSPTPNFNPIQQTTELNHNFSNPSTASSNSKDANEEKTNKGGVIVGVIVGAILGSILIGLIGYFICGKKRSESFSHRRLYDDTRNDPVLHLDNSLGPYDVSFGCASDDKTSTEDKAEKDNAGCPSDGIPMADMTPSHPSS
ncbi:MUC15 protein, partial [Calonectris borealis]|nr:MUC15 protein [Calonectris borealis]